jgi:hypothetical protein
MMEGWLIIVGVIEIIVPFITALTFGAIPLLAAFLDPTASILDMNNILKVSYTLTLAALIRRM